MPLTLVTIPNPTQSFLSGLIAIRAEDFVGPARGDLTTAADANSLAGTVVVDTQAISLATTTVSYTTRWAAASDTIQIPWATLTALFRPNTFGAYFFATLKVEGDTATGGDGNDSTHLQWSSIGLGPGMAWGADTTLRSNAVAVRRSVWGDQYLMSYPEFITTANMTGTNLTMRVWGITGGTLSFSVDAIYAVAAISDYAMQTFPSDFPVMIFDTDGTMFLNDDSAASDVQFGGHHSVTWMDQNPINNIFTLADIQQADAEPTYLDINGGGSWDGSAPPPEADPLSWMCFMAAPIYLPPQNLISDSFNNTVSSTGSLNPCVSTPARFNKTLFFGNFSPSTPGDGVSEQGGFLRARLHANQPAPTPITTSSIPHCDVFFGNCAVRSGDTNTPDKQHPLLATLEDCTQTFSFDVSALGVYRIICGQTDNVTASPYVSNGAILEIDGGGGLNLSLVTTEASFVPLNGGSGVDARVTIDGPVAISGFGTTTTFWLKVQRQRYFWKAKCWQDGNTEPDWQVEGFQYLVWRASGGGSPPRGTVAEPYNVNWVGDTDHDIVLRDPTDSRGYPFITFETGFAQPACDVRVFQYDLDVPDEDNDPVDMHVMEEKWDGSEQWDSVTIPYETLQSWRMVEGSLRHRHFDGDTHGMNIHCWKNRNGPVLQQSAVPWLFERARPEGGNIPLYRPRVFSVATP